MASENDAETEFLGLKDDFNKIKDLPVEQLPSSVRVPNDKRSHEKLTDFIATTLLKVGDGDTRAYFELGQLYFEQGDYGEAKVYFEKIRGWDSRARYQLAIMAYDGLGTEDDQIEGVQMLKEIALGSPKYVHRSLAHAAEYNIGRACYQGYGVRQNTEEALKWWVLAADSGSSRGSVMAQTTLGYYYSQTDSRDLKKAYFWHSEACGNGSVESQGCLGIMYLHGLCVKRNTNTAFHILKEASERGNVYAMGNLVAVFYKKKMFTKSTELAIKVLCIDDVRRVAKESCCLREFVSKGVAIASFIYGRCLHKGLGVKGDINEAHRFYSRCFQYDADVCAQMQDLANRGQI